MFINHLKRELNSNTQIKAFKCLNNNLNQLNQLMDFIDDDLKLEIQKIHKNFMNSLLNNKLNDLNVLNIQLENIIREKLNKEKDTNSIDATQSYYLTLIIILMFTVRLS